jgi:hypothetical protein
MRIRRSPLLTAILSDPKARAAYERALQTDRSEVEIQLGGEKYKLKRVGVQYARTELRHDDDG